MADEPAVKPPLPARMFDPFPRIDVDTSDGGVFARILHLGVLATNEWMLGPDGPLEQSMTLAEITNESARWALLHLLELGLIDIDVERLNDAPGIPTRRSTLRGEETDR